MRERDREREAEAERERERERGRGRERERDKESNRKAIRKKRACEVKSVCYISSCFVNDDFCT